MRRKIICVITFLIALFSSFSAYAKNNVSKIDITAEIQKDGGCQITQVWTGNFNDGTENYIPIRTGDISVYNFEVSDSKNVYTYTDNWDVDASFEEKKNKCGINNTDDGIELCFGISEYGNNVYTIKYTVDGFIKSYTDYDGVNFMFVNPDMNTFPTSASVLLKMGDSAYLDENNSSIWAFGYDGDIEFENGCVLARTSSPLKDSNRMIILLRLDKGLVSPAVKENKSFEKVKEEAFEGSDYKSRFSIIEILEIAAFVIFFFFIIYAFIMNIIRKIKNKKFYKNCNYFREVPNGGNIYLSHYLSRTFGASKQDSLIIGALLLSMINKHCLEACVNESTGIFGKTKSSTDIMLKKEPDDANERTLYYIIMNAAGEDGILQEKELQKYAYRNPEVLENFIKGSLAIGKSDMINKGGFIKGAGNSINKLSDKGKDELSQVMGLKKYLLDFSLISERSINEIDLWQDYLIYATLFDIADKVMDELKKVYPDKIPEIEDYRRNVVLAYGYYHSMNSSYKRAMQQKRSSGRGGAASFGGGGGFSGGGSGGGSR